jgi:nicotinamidase-related amidase
MAKYINADPYKWPYNGDMTPSNTCIMVIDMQVDFCMEGGYVDKMGYGIDLMREPIEPIQKVLECMREKGFHVMQYKRKGHRHDLPTAPTRMAVGAIGAEIGRRVPCTYLSRRARMDHSRAGTLTWKWWSTSPEKGCRNELGPYSS